MIALPDAVFEDLNADAAEPAVTGTCTPATPPCPEARGATVLRGPDDEIRWWVTADPEGNEFCAFAPR